MTNIMRKGVFAYGVFAALAAALALSVLAGCQNPLASGHTGEPGASGATGTVTLSVADAGRNRTIMPQLPGGDVEYRLEYRKGDSGDVGETLWSRHSPNVELASGEWRIRLTQLVSGDLEIARSDWTDISVEPGQNITCELRLIPIGDGEGRFGWEISFPREVGRAEMRIVRLDGTDEAVEITLGLPNANGQRVLPVGEYRVVFSLYPSDGTTATEIGRILHVSRNLESRFADDDGLLRNFVFPSALLDTILGAWNGSVWNFDLGGGRRIVAGHFGLLGITGVDADNFAGLAARFNLLTNSANRPADLAGLGNLVDASLVSLFVGSPDFDLRADKDWTQTGVRDAIVAGVGGLNTPLSAGNFSWGASDRYEPGEFDMKVGVGGFETGATFVPVPVTGISITGVNTFLVPKTETRTFTAAVNPANARDQRIGWEIRSGGEYVSIPNPAEGTYASSMTLRGEEEGTGVVIHAVSVGNRNFTAEITGSVVHEPVPIEGIWFAETADGPAIANATVTIGANRFKDVYIRLIPGNTTYRDVEIVPDFDASIVSAVFADGRLRITGLNPGSTSVTVKSAENETVFGTLSVQTVRPDPTSVGVRLVDGTNPIIIDGTEESRVLEFAATVEPPEAGQDVTWSVSPPSPYVSIDANGVLTVTRNDALVHGQTLTVAATTLATPDVKGETTAVVQIWPAGIAIAPRPATVHRGTSLQFTATVSPVNAPGEDVSWEVAGHVGASVSQSGLLTVRPDVPIGTGLTVTATTTTPAGSTARSDTLTVTVTGPAPDSVSVSPENAIWRGDTTHIDFTVTMSGPAGFDHGLDFDVIPSVNGRLEIVATNADDPELVSIAVRLTEVAGHLDARFRAGADAGKEATARVTVTGSGDITVVVPEFPPTGGGIDVGDGDLSFSLLGPWITITAMDPATPYKSVKWLLDDREITHAVPGNLQTFVSDDGRSLNLRPRIFGDLPEHLIGVGVRLFTVIVEMPDGGVRSRTLAVTVTQ